MASIINQLESLLLSAVELKALNGWPDPQIEDYLNIFRNIDVVAGGVDENSEQIEQNTLNITINAANIAINAADIDALEALLFNNYSLTSNRITEANEIIITNGFDVTLNGTPKDSERVYIKINDSTQLTIDGNGKLIDGSGQLRGFRAYQTILVVYDETAGAWFII